MCTLKLSSSVKIFKQQYNKNKHTVHNVKDIDKMLRTHYHMVNQLSIYIYICEHSDSSSLDIYFLEQVGLKVCLKGLQICAEPQGFG